MEARETVAQRDREGARRWAARYVAMQPVALEDPEEGPGKT